MVEGIETMQKEYWSEAKKIVYNDCLKNVCDTIKKSKNSIALDSSLGEMAFNSFDGSVVISICFGISKEEALKDIILYIRAKLMLKE